MRKRPKTFSEFTNIRVLPSGYQVAITRAKTEITRHFAGHSEESLQAALRFRDRVLRSLPDKRLNPIPRRVLAALGLKEPVPGVFRRGWQNAYSVMYEDRGRKRARQFSYKLRPEVEAYAAAVQFRREKAATTRRGERK
ncbi:MAG TPA: AP2 domain-containing protein [Chthoniobacterales bacterium]|nr:AP2 domain-containing protein [Chthoniobacterales bacterium]